MQSVNNNLAVLDDELTNVSCEYVTEAIASLPLLSYYLAIDNALNNSST